MSEALYLTLELGGACFSLGGGELPLLSASGLEASDYVLALGDAGAVDGAYIGGAKFDARTIIIRTETSDPETRLALISALNPRADGVLTARRGGICRKIAFRVKEAAFDQPNRYSPCRLELTLCCPDPFFTDPAATTVEFKKTAALLTFPFNSLAGCGLTSGIWRVSDTAVIVNDGDADIGITCEITAAGGSVTNPTVSLTGGGSVKALTVLSDGDIMTLCTVRGNKSIRINGENAFVFERTSVFFQLPPGVNTVVISADAGASYENARFSYTLRYNGI